MLKISDYRGVIMYHLDFRPDNFEGLLGNLQLKKSISGLLKKPDHPHSYLLYGDSGCGKTTIARIITNTLNITNIREINCADDNGIETARNIIKEMQYKDLTGSATAYILDEIHSVSKNFQNGLLKPLEDTPNHVYFFLCTTNPEKLLKTVRNRCTQYKVEKPDNRELLDYLQKILYAQEQNVNRRVLKYLINQCDSVPRLCLTTLEKVVEVENEEDQKHIIDRVSANENQAIELCRMLLKGGDWNSVSVLLKNITGEPETIRRIVLSYMSKVLLSGNDRAALVIDCFSENYYDSGFAGLVKSCYEVFL